MSGYGQKVPKPATCDIGAVPGPVAQQIEHRIPNAGAAGAIPAGVTPANKLRLAARKNQDATWLAIRARLDFIEEMVAAGVPRHDAYVADGSLQLARRLPPASRAKACERIGTWLARKARSSS